VTPGGDCVDILDAKQVENISEDVKLFAAIETKMNPQKWVKNREPPVVEVDKLKLRTIVLYDGRLILEQSI